MRRLLNEKMEPPSIDFRQPAGGVRHCAGCARAVIDQCHLTNQRSWPCGLEHKIAKQDLHFPFQQHVHLLSFVALAEERIAGRELQRVGVVTKKLRRIHEYNVIGDRDYKGDTITAKLRLCDNRSGRHGEEILRVLREKFLLNHGHERKQRVITSPVVGQLYFLEKKDARAWPLARRSVAEQPRATGDGAARACEPSTAAPPSGPSSYFNLSLTVNQISLPPKPPGRVEKK
jgi:hypothetical protein